MATARRRNSIPGQRTISDDPEILSASQAAVVCGVFHSAIRRLVEFGILPMNQVVPWAPWEIRRSDLESPEVREALRRLREKGTFGLRGDVSQKQQTLF